MSGHSKWSSIKHKKGLKDARRGKLFTKLIREVTVAAKHGGGDPASNSRLRLAVQAARDQNMPLDTVNRAIARGAGGGDGIDYEEVIYEGYGPANVAVVIEALTDNRNRTVASLRQTFGKFNGNMGATNSVQFMFDRKGTLLISKDAIGEDQLTEHVLEVGAEDLDTSGEDYFVICAPEDFARVKTYLEEQGVPILSAELTRLPQTQVPIADKQQAEAVLNFLDMLEDDDDVQNVFANFDIDDAVLAELS